MATEKHNEPLHSSAASRKIRVNALEAPSDLPERFHPTAAEEGHMQGVVETKDIRSLLNTFGLTEVKEISIPFHHVKRGDRSTFSLRIEGPASHPVDGDVMVGHQWLFRREWPESVGTSA